ncbi:MAG: DUF1801 domain-containing protein [Acidobacteriia bacterium]|nr:DUF1801 domain-containing protein [Terriglobia bacterium]
MRTKKANSSNKGSTSKGNVAPKSVKEYLASVPEPARSTLNKVRAAIRSAVPPEATEGISYRIPMFKYKGALVWFAAFSNHCSFFPGSLAVMAAFKDELKAYHTSKGTIRFPVDKPLPATLVKKLVRARLAEKERKK